jgi:hypothetical protein
LVSDNIGDVVDGPDLSGLRLTTLFALSTLTTGFLLTFIAF